MPQVANVAISDGTVSRTYEPDNVSSSKTIFLDRSPGQANLQNSIVLERRTTPSGVYRANMNLNFVLPQTDSTTGKTSVASRSQIKIETAFAPDLPLSERQRIFTIAVNALSASLLRSVVRDGESLF